MLFGGQQKEKPERSKKSFERARVPHIVSVKTKKEKKKIFCEKVDDIPMVFNRE